MTPATITIARSKWDHLGHDIHRGVYLIAQLREAGVPVEGAIWPIAVTTGCLVHYSVGSDLVWSYTP